MFLFYEIKDTASLFFAASFAGELAFFLFFFDNPKTKFYNWAKILQLYRQLYFKMTLTNVSQDKNVKEFFQLFLSAVSF